MLHLSASPVSLRQTLATGRISERVTGRSLGATSARLSAREGLGQPSPIAARFAPRAEGYFGFDVVPARDMPCPSGSGRITLQAVLQLDGGRPIVSEVTVPAAALGLEDATRIIDGRVTVVKRVRGAPFDLSIEVDPAPVSLQGIVLHANDPAQPVAGVTVEAGPADTVTGGDGRFFLAPLPLQAVVTLKLAKNGATASQSFRIDYDRAVNTVILSLPA